MAEAKHTRGPWRIKQQAGIGSVVRDANGAHVATVYEPQCASLVAAAPELLEALEDVLAEWVRDLTEAGDEDPEDKAYVKFARAAIAKATGSAA